MISDARLNSITLGKLTYCACSPSVEQTAMATYGIIKLNLSTPYIYLMTKSRTV